MSDTTIADLIAMRTLLESTPDVMSTELITFMNKIVKKESDEDFLNALIVFANSWVVTKTSTMSEFVNKVINFQKYVEMLKSRANAEKQPIAELRKMIYDQKATVYTIMRVFGEDTLYARLWNFESKVVYVSGKSIEYLENEISSLQSRNAELQRQLLDALDLLAKRPAVPKETELPVTKEQEYDTKVAEILEAVKKQYGKSKTPNIDKMIETVKKNLSSDVVFKTGKTKIDFGEEEADEAQLSPPPTQEEHEDKN